MEQRESKRCFILDKDVYLIHEITMDLRDNLIIKGRGDRRCSEAFNCDKLKNKCKWVSMEYNFDGMNPKNLPPADENPLNN